MKPKEIYGLSRSRDKTGKVVKRSFNPYVNCLPTQVGSARDNMEVYVIEICDGQETDDPAPKSGGQIKDGCMIDTYHQQIQYDVSCTIRTNINTANLHFIVEKCDSKENISTHTKVSIGTPHKSSSADNLGGISRTVKTYDSLATLVMEKIIKVGNYSPSGHNASSIVNSEGISPAVMENHGTVTAVLEPVIGAMRGRNPDNPNERGKSNGNYQQRLEVNENGTSIPEATTKGYAEPKIQQVGNIYPDTDNFKNRTHGRVYSPEGLSPTPRTRDNGQTPSIVQQQPRYRIRKLTPRECFRLMGCDEETIDTIQAAGISNSQQYKLAGNSIVVDVLYHLFRKMFVETENESQQLTLF